MHEERESVKQTNKQPQTLLEYKAEQVVRLLVERIAEIPDVKGWAEEAGVSRRWLCKTMKAVYGKSPKIILREVRYEKVVRLIRKDGIDATCYSVAVDAGFGESKKVSMFLSSFYDTNFTKLKMELLQKDAQINFLWLNGTIK